MRVVLAAHRPTECDKCPGGSPSARRFAAHGVQCRAAGSIAVRGAGDGRGLPPDGLGDRAPPLVSPVVPRPSHRGCCGSV